MAASSRLVGWRRTACGKIMIRIESLQRCLTILAGVLLLASVPKPQEGGPEADQPGQQTAEEPATKPGPAAMPMAASAT